MFDQPHLCRNELCDYTIAGSAAYCCGPCADADDGRYEIHDHSPLCARRPIEPGTFPIRHRDASSPKNLGAGTPTKADLYADDVAPPEIHVEATRYDVCAMPAGARDAGFFAIKVERWGDGTWTVSYRSRYFGSRGGFGAGSTEHFTLEDALELAKQQAPRVKSGGMTAVEYLARSKRAPGRG